MDVIACQKLKKKKGSKETEFRKKDIPEKDRNQFQNWKITSFYNLVNIGIVHFLHRQN